MGDLENLKNCLVWVKETRSASAKLWKSLSDGVEAKHGIEGGEKKFLTDLKAYIDNVNRKIGDLSQALNQQQHVPNSLPLGHSIYLSMDAVTENMPLYSNLVSSYKWLDKVHDYSQSAVAYLSQNSLNKSFGKITRQKKRQTNPLVQLGQAVTLDRLIGGLSDGYIHMNLQISRPNGTQLNTLVEVTLGRVLKAVLVFKGLMTEWVSVKGFNEEITKSDGQLDVWGESKYEVFRRITQNANAAMLNFQAAMYPELSVKLFLTYLHSFNNLFTKQCTKCSYYLHNNLPPTWREFKTLEPYHEDCRP